MIEDGEMSARMTIGDFSQATRLSAKALRFYHREGLLVPAGVDPSNGYRLYAPEQIADAQVIRRLRALDVPVETIRELLGSPDVATRNELVVAHLARLEERLASTRAAISSLRGMLADAAPRAEITHRTLPPTPALVIRDRIDLRDLGDWFTRSRSDLADLAQHPGVTPSGPRGGLWATELFLDERGEAALFQPVASPGDERSIGPRARFETLPAADVAVAVHRGPDDTIADTYAALGAHVTEHELGIPGPIRESYLEEPSDDSGLAVTEIAWPIFRVAR
jgi:DNA-binding transcriptional MerR regulator